MEQTVQEERITLDVVDQDELISRFVDFSTQPRNTSLVLGGGLSSTMANNALLQTASDLGWEGNGTVEYPIVISGYRFVNMSSSVAISFYRTTLHVIFERNIIDVNDGLNLAQMFYVQYSSNIVVRHNLFIDQGSGIGGSVRWETGPSENITIEDNVFVSNTAIFLKQVSGVTISNNTIFANSGVSISELGDKYADVFNSNNIYVSASGISMSAISPVNSSVVVQDNFIQSGSHSVSVTNLNEMTVVGNTLNSSGGYGLKLASSFRNTILSNDFGESGVDLPDVTSRSELQADVSGNTAGAGDVHYYVDEVGIQISDPAFVFIYYSQGVSVTGSGGVVTKRLVLVNTSQISLTGLVFGDTLDTAFEGSGLEDVTIQDCMFSNVGYSGVSISDSTGVNVIGGVFDTVANDAISLYNVNDSYIVDNWAYHISESFVDFGVGENSVISRNLVVDVQNSETISIYRLSNAVMEGNYLYDNYASDAISGYLVSDLLIRSNYISVTDDDGIDISTADNVSVVDNYLEWVNYYSVYLYNTENSTIQGNSILGGNNGFYLFWCDNIDITDNLVNRSYIGMSIYLQVNKTVVISGNIIMESYAKDIYLSSGNVSLQNNDLYNSTNGVLVSTFESNVSASGNYWEVWNSPDADQDGVVDLPYNESGVIDPTPVVEPMNTPVIEELTVSATDVQYTEGETGNLIAWDFTGFGYVLYTVESGGEVVAKGISSSPVLLPVDGLTAGNYSFTLNVSKIFGGYLQSTVTVSVRPVPTTTSTSTTSTTSSSTTTSTSSVTSSTTSSAATDTLSTSSQTSSQTSSATSSKKETGGAWIPMTAVLSLVVTVSLGGRRRTRGKKRF